MQSHYCVATYSQGFCCTTTNVKQERMIRPHSMPVVCVVRCTVVCPLIHVICTVCSLPAINAPKEYRNRSKVPAQSLELWRNKNFREPSEKIDIMSSGFIISNNFIFYDRIKNKIIPWSPRSITNIYPTRCIGFFRIIISWHSCQ